MKYFYTIVISLLLIFFVVVFFYHSLIGIPNFVSNDNKEHAYNVFPNSTPDSLLQLVYKDYKVLSESIFKYQCKQHNLKRLKPGHYVFPSKMGNKQMIRILLTNNQTPINLTFTNVIRTKSELARTISKQLMLDSLDIIRKLNDNHFLEKYGVDKYNSISLFMPNTYNVYWTITPEKLFDKMYDEYKKFWNQERLYKASKLNLSPSQITTIASIVESESNKQEEYETIAGLYLNRLKKNMFLQACPTVIFAIGDFSLRRIKTEHLNYISPYNTYINRGLPPGPIRCVNVSTIEKVLDAPKTDALYMCARNDHSGYHHFSTSFKEHQAYAKKYRQMLNEINIR